MLRAIGVEKFDKLLAGRLIVPVAVVFDDDEKFVHRAFLVAARIEGHGEVEARLMILRIGVELCPQLLDVAKVARLFGQREGGFGGGEVGIVAPVGPDQRKRLARAV